MLLFRHPNKKVDYDLKIKIDGKKLQSSTYVKYLGVLLDAHLNWSHHTTTLAAKLNRAIGMLAKIRHYVDEKSLRNIYFGIFSSVMTYASQIWGQFSNKHVIRIQKLQNRALRVINNAKFGESSSPLYYKSKILKLTDQIRLENFYLVQNDLKGELPTPLLDTFKIIADTHDHNTRGSAQHKLSLPKIRTQAYGITLYISIAT